MSTWIGVQSVAYVPTVITNDPGGTNRPPISKTSLPSGCYSTRSMGLTDHFAPTFSKYPTGGQSWNRP